MEMAALLEECVCPVERGRDDARSRSTGTHNPVRQETTTHDPVRFNKSSYAANTNALWEDLQRGENIPFPRIRKIFSNQPSLDTTP